MDILNRAVSLPTPTAVSIISMCLNFCRHELLPFRLLGLKKAMKKFSTSLRPTLTVIRHLRCLNVKILFDGKIAKQVQDKVRTLIKQKRVK